MKYKAFLTDLIGVLIEDTWKIGMEIALSSRGWEADAFYTPPTIKYAQGNYKNRSSIISKKYWPLWSLGKMNAEKYWQKCFEVVGRNYEKEKRKYERYLKYVPFTTESFPEFLTREVISTFPERYSDVFDFVEECSDNGLKVGLVTNTSEELFREIKRQNSSIWSQKHKKELSLGERFDLILPSYEVGVRKPDRRIYEIALERLGVKPEETAYIDNEDSDVEGARNIGITALKFDPDSIKYPSNPTGVRYRDRIIRKDLMLIRTLLTGD